jgi:ectoine hydroxylase-related dioxygenase (phytanoyl-CoA dioxygenase family)
MTADAAPFARHGCFGQLPLLPAASFSRDGFLAPLPLLRPAELRELRSCIDHAEQHKFAGRLPPQWVNAALEYEPIWRLVVKNERLLEIAARIFECDDVLHFSTTVFTKPPLNPDASDPPKRVGYHQDLLNWNLTPGKVLTCWLAVDDADEENGCLHVVPGTHAHGLMDHSTNYDPSNVLMAYQDIDPALFGGLEAAMPLPLPAGSASLHDGYTVHGSPPNRSKTRRRCGVTVQLIPDEVKVGPFLYTGEGMNTETVTEDDWRKPIVVLGKSGRTDLHPAPF